MRGRGDSDQRTDGNGHSDKHTLAEVQPKPTRTAHTMICQNRPTRTFAKTPRRPSRFQPTAQQKCGLVQLNGHLGRQTRRAARRGAAPATSPIPRFLRTRTLHPRRPAPSRRRDRPSVTLPSRSAGPLPRSFQQRRPSDRVSAAEESKAMEV